MSARVESGVDVLSIGVAALVGSILSSDNKADIALAQPFCRAVFLDLAELKVKSKSVGRVCWPVNPARQTDSLSIRRANSLSRVESSPALLCCPISTPTLP